MTDYDDHDYCLTCQRHARTCWCWDGNPHVVGEPGPEDCPGGEGHDEEQL